MDAAMDEGLQDSPQRLHEAAILKRYNVS